MPLFGRLKNLLGGGRDGKDSVSMMEFHADRASVSSMASSASSASKLRRFSVNQLFSHSPKTPKAPKTPKRGRKAAARSLPAGIRQDVDPWECWDEIGELGDGAYGKVKKVQHRADRDRLAAAKVITLEEEGDVQDFVVEIEILTACAHPNIVGLQEAFLYDNCLWILLEFCGGGAVDGIMLELDKPLTEKQIAYLTREVCKGLAFLHSRLVIHRDLKAGNILLTSDAQVKLADFGVSAQMRSAAARRDSFIGTPYWMAPEVMVCETFKDTPYDTRADVWSLGVTLIECAQMEPPNSEYNPMRVLLKVQKSPPPTLDRPNLWSKVFQDFLAKCLVKDPGGRIPVEATLQHPFVRDATSARPLLELLAEVKAEVVEEEIEEEDETASNSHLPLPDASLGGLSDVSSAYLNGSAEPLPSPAPLTNGDLKRHPSDALPPPPEVRPEPQPPAEEARKESLGSDPPGSKKKKRAPPPPKVPDVPSKSEAKATAVDTVIPATTPAKEEAEAIGVLDDLYATLRADGQSPTPEDASMPKVSPTPEPAPMAHTAPRDEPASPESPLSPSFPPPPSDLPPVHRPSTSSGASGSLGPPTPLEESAEPLDAADMARSASSGVEEGQSRPSSGEGSVGRHQLVLSTEEHSGDGFLSVSEMTVMRDEREATGSSTAGDDASSTTPPPVFASSGRGPLEVTTENGRPASSTDGAGSEWSSQSEGLSSSAAGPPEQRSPGVRGLRAIHEAQISDPVGTPTRPKSGASGGPVERRVSSGSGSRWEERFGGRNSSHNSSKDSVEIPSGLIARNKELIRQQHEAFHGGPSTDSPKPKPPPPPPKSRQSSTPPSTFSSGSTSGGVSSSDGAPSNQGAGNRKSVSEIARLMAQPEEPAPTPSAGPPVAFRRSASPGESSQHRHSGSSIKDRAESIQKALASSAEKRRSASKSPLPEGITPPPPKSPGSQPPKSGYARMEELVYFGDYAGTSQPSSSSDLSREAPQPAGQQPRHVLPYGIPNGQVGYYSSDSSDFVRVADSSLPSSSTASQPSTLERRRGHPPPPPPQRVSSRPPSRETEPPAVGGAQPDEVQEAVVIPPPEPPIDYDESPRVSQVSRDSHILAYEEAPRPAPKAAAQPRPRPKPQEAPPPTPKAAAQESPVALHNGTPPTAVNGQPNGNGAAATPSNGARRDPLKRTLMRKTRVYEIDGKKVSSTTYHILADDGVSFKTKADHALRRAELQDIKRMQREESRQLSEMSLHAQMMRDAAEKKAEQERASVMRTFEVDLEALSRVQKRQLEETERAQEEELKAAAKKAASEKERDLRAFRDSLRMELKVAKTETELLPKAQRKEALRQRLRALEADHQRREGEFEAQRNADIEASLRRIQEGKKAHIALLERQFLQQKHQLLRAKEAAHWELEEKQLKEAHQLDRQQLKDAFFLQRTLLLTKHAKELEQIKKFSASKLDECQRAMAAERKRLPKVLRSETKTRSLMFKESLRISGATDSGEMAERIRAFEEQEKRRVAAELRKQEAKHKRKLEQVKAEQERSLRDHEQLQNEKRRMLLDHENRKLKENEMAYSDRLKGWKLNLKPRKQALESSFQSELESQDHFYATDPTVGSLRHHGSQHDLVD